MRPGNALERRVETLASSLRDLTPAQREWGLSHIIPHWCTYWTRSHKATCVTCGHTWKEKNPKRCPHCGAKLKLLKDSRKRRFIEERYYGIVQTVEEFTVIRIFYLCDNRKIGSPHVGRLCTEILQHWIGPDGRDTIRARRISMFSAYRYCVFTLSSVISLKRDVSQYGYRNTHYHIRPHGFYPWGRCGRILSRNGFKGDFHGLLPEDVFHSLLSDNRFETLWKLGLFKAADHYLYHGKTAMTKYWRQVLMAHKAGYAIGDYTIWFDYLDLLGYFHKDISSPKYLFPDDLHKEHDRLMEKKRVILEREELVRRKEREKEKLAILASKSPYFGITFGNDRLFVIVLKTLEDYKREIGRAHV